MNWRIFLPLLFYAAATLAGSAGAQGVAPPGSRPAVALALDIRGATEPVYEPFSEFAAGQSVTLKDEAEIEFLHYPTCETVVVKGGELAFSEQRYTARGGKVADVKRSKCPKTVSLGSDTQIGGVVLRSIPGPQVLSLATRPGFVVVGGKRHAFKQVRVRREGQILFEGALAGNRFDWPDGRPPLDTDGNYTLELIAAPGESRAFAFRAEDRRGEAPLTVVRLD